MKPVADRAECFEHDCGDDKALSTRLAALPAARDPPMVSLRPNLDFLYSPKHIIANYRAESVWPRSGNLTTFNAIKRIER